MASTSSCFRSLLRNLETQKKLEPVQVKPDEKQEAMAKNIHLIQFDRNHKQNFHIAHHGESKSLEDHIFFGGSFSVNSICGLFFQKKKKESVDFSLW